MKWRHPSGRQVIAARHGNKPVPVGTLKSIIEGSGLTMDDFRSADRVRTREEVVRLLRTAISSEEAGRNRLQYPRMSCYPA